MRVGIVGGGIGGLASAIALSARGVEVTVFERAPAIAEVGAGLSLWPNATAALKALGVLEACVARSGALLVGEIRRADGRVLSRTQIHAQSTPGIAMHRADLQAALLARIPQDRVRLGATCVAVETAGDAATVRLADGSAHGFDVVVGADGLRSIAREAVCGKAEPRYRGYTAWRGIAPAAGGRPPHCPPGEILRDGHVFEAWGRGRRFGTVSIGAGRTYWFATCNAPEHARAPGGEEIAEVRRLFAGWHEPIGAILAATDGARVVRGDVYDRDPAPGWVRGRIALIGDAAHPTTPNLGQGGCMALEDAVVLARALEKFASDVPRALAAFERVRWPRAAMIVRESRRLGAVGQWESRLATGLRNTLTRLTPASFVERRLAPITGYRADLVAIE